MKNLTIALLLSFAPAVLKADNQPCLPDVAPEIVAEYNKCSGCDKAEAIELKVVDNAQATDATRATVTISGENIPAEKWEKIQQYGRMIYGEPVVANEQTLRWVFDRNERSTEEWFAHLSNIEAAFVAVRSSVTSFCDTDPVSVTIELQ